MKQGIQSRLLWVTLLVLSIGLTLTGLILERSHRGSVVTGAEEQLRLLIYSLMGSVRDQGETLDFSGALLEPRLTQPDSGLYAAISGEGGRLRWLSPSAEATGVPFPFADRRLAPGEFQFLNVAEGGVPRFVLSYAVIWEGPEDRVLTFSVATDQAPFRLAITDFRRNLTLGMLLVLGVFILAQILAVRWGLRPLRVMADEVELLERGEQERLGGPYPPELQSLANNLGRFIDHEQRSRARYRKAMEDLAHSLKTPLSVLRNAFARAPANDAALDRPLLLDQLERMETSVGYQLSRASATGPVTIGRRVDLAALTRRMLRALETAYRDRAIEVELDLPELIVRADERDLMEMVGNLLENAFKYTRRRIRIRGLDGDRPGLAIEDDGPGIAPDLREAVLHRGTRADEVQKGQGIGLAVVAELVALYRGQLVIEDSDLGGACISLRLPG